MVVLPAAVAQQTRRLLEAAGVLEQFLDERVPTARVPSVHK